LWRKTGAPTSGGKLAKSKSSLFLMKKSHATEKSGILIEGISFE
jgi:hypothetical protein